MPEPIDPIVRCPPGGWSRLAVRLDMHPSVKHLRDAAYELASYSRRHRIGCVATWEGSDLYAYPDRTTGQIEDGWRRMREMERAGLGQAPRPAIERWTIQRKAGLVFAVAEGFVARADVVSIYGLSEEELASWEARYKAFGAEGLASRKLQELPRIDREVA